VKKRILFGATAASIAALAIVAAAVGSANRQAGPTVLPASSCGKLQYGGSGSPKFIIASDLPLQGASRALMVEMGKAVQFTIEQQGSTRSATRRVTTRPPSKEAGIRRSAPRTPLPMRVISP
jgi:hypothetical protein